MQNRGFYNQTSVQLKSKQFELILVTLSSTGIATLSRCFFQVDCLEGTKSGKIGWLFRLTECINEFYLNTDDKWLETTHSQIFLKPAITRSGSTVKTIYYKKMDLETFTCDPVSSSIELFVSASYLLTPFSPSQKCHHFLAFLIVSERKRARSGQDKRKFEIFGKFLANTGSGFTGSLTFPGHQRGARHLQQQQLQQEIKPRHACSASSKTRPQQPRKWTGVLV